MTSVVLADDQDLVRRGLRALLQARGVDVLAEAEHGRAAIAAAREHRPDVVVMDIRMPVMDGIAATREIAAAGLPTRVLVLTTTTSTSTSTRPCAPARVASCSSRARPTGSSTRSRSSPPARRCWRRA